MLVYLRCCGPLLVARQQICLILSGSEFVKRLETETSCFWSNSHGETIIIMTSCNNKPNWSLLTHPVAHKHRSPLIDLHAQVEVLGRHQQIIIIYMHAPERNHQQPTNNSKVLCPVSPEKFRTFWGKSNEQHDLDRHKLATFWSKFKIVRSIY